MPLAAAPARWLSAWPSCADTRLGWLRCTGDRRVFVGHAGKVGAQHVVDAPIAEAPTRLGDLHDLGAQILARLAGSRWMTPAVAGQLHKPARAPLGYIALLGHDPDGRLLLRASRWQLVPGIFNEREAYMSEKQMTQRAVPNTANRKIPRSIYEDARDVARTAISRTGCGTAWTCVASASTPRTYAGDGRASSAGMHKSLVVIAIGAAHAIPPVLGATWGKTKAAVLFGAAVAVAIGFASGNPAFIAADLFGVALGTWWGFALVGSRPKSP